MDYGWVSVHRQLQEHWLWKDKPFSYGQAWIDLIMMANHTDKKFLLGKELVEVKAGSFITSELKLMERWGWGKSRVRTFLDLLQKDEMIEKKVNRKRTTICIVNYSSFQDTRTINKLIANRLRTDCEPIANTNNNDNNDNNINNNILYAENPALNNSIIKFIEHRKKMKKPMTDEAIRLMVDKLNKLSGNVEEQIEIINQSIVNGWQGIFPLKNNQNNQKNKKGGRKEAVPEWLDKKKKRNFDNYSQRDYDNDELEKKLLNRNRTPANDEELAARLEKLKADLRQN